MKNMFQSGDVVIGTSASANSRNLLKAIEFANENGCIVVGLTGYNGGKLKQIANYGIHISIDDIPIAKTYT